MTGDGWALDATGLRTLTERTTGRPEIAVALLDGPVALDHPELAGATLRPLGPAAAGCATAGPACAHGTFVAGVLCARRSSPAPALAPGCTILLSPIFADSGRPPSADPEAVAEAVAAAVRAGARVVNLSAGPARPSPSGLRSLELALEFAAHRQVVVVAAAGNEPGIGGSAITRHPAVIPVLAVGSDGRPRADATLAATVGRRGLAAPGDDVVSLAPGGGTARSSGSSVAAPFVSGTLALLWSLAPAAPTERIKAAVLGARPRRVLVPPLLDAAAAYAALARA